MRFPASGTYVVPGALSRSRSIVAADRGTSTSSRTSGCTTATRPQRFAYAAVASSARSARFGTSDIGAVIVTAQVAVTEARRTLHFSSRGPRRRLGERWGPPARVGGRREVRGRFEGGSRCAGAAQGGTEPLRASLSPRDCGRMGRLRQADASVRQRATTSPSRSSDSTASRSSASCRVDAGSQRRAAAFPRAAGGTSPRTAPACARPVARAAGWASLGQRARARSAECGRGRPSRRDPSVPAPPRR